MKRISSLHARWLLALLGSAAFAQTAPGPTAPELFAGELNDLGPQFLLQPGAAAAPRYEAWTDFELTGTSNVTLAPSHPTASTLLSAQGGITWRGLAQARWGGRFNVEAGLRGQAYRYGFLSNANHPVDFIEIDRNNFDLAGAHTQGVWRRGNWLATAGLRGATLRSRSTGRQFYREAVGDAQLVRQWGWRQSTFVAAGVDGARRWTRTDSFGLLPASWNDRAELAAFVTLEQRLGAHWRLQPSARVQGARYTHADRRRTDRHLFARLTLARDLGSHAELRLSLGHEQRESTEVLITDYRKWDLGLGGSARWTF
jgi:hypothetical protein